MQTKDVHYIPFLSAGNILPLIETDGAFPVLGANFESTLAGLYFTSHISTGAFGPFCGFVKGGPMTAEIIVAGMAKTAAV